MRSPRTRQALKLGFTSAAAMTVAHDLAKQFSKLLGSYVDPNSFTFNEARGYWAHTNQDCQRIAGHFRIDGASYSFGSWDHTLSALARSGCHIIDERNERRPCNMFLIEKGRGDPERDTSNDWYSGPQVEEINRLAALNNDKEQRK